MITRIAYSGNKRYCPICKGNFRGFQDAGVSPRPNAKCPGCGALERHRLVWRYLEDRTDIFQRREMRMLHVAAEPCLASRLRHVVGAGYLTADLIQPADIKMDITDIQFPDDSFDIVYCSHVLEHVPDDRKAMREFHRVLKPTGFALLLVPITVEQTVEDPSVTDPQERLRLFGQDDHVRRYGRDYIDRLREAGFSVEMIRADDFLTTDEIERTAVGGSTAGEVFHCTKS